MSSPFLRLSLPALQRCALHAHHMVCVDLWSGYSWPFPCRCEHPGSMTTRGAASWWTLRQSMSTSRPPHPLASTPLVTQGQPTLLVTPLAV
jgi:hypothetical protein